MFLFARPSNQCRRLICQIAKAVGCEMCVRDEIDACVCIICVRDVFVYVRSMVGYMCEEDLNLCYVVQRFTSWLPYYVQAIGLNSANSAGHSRY